jgi:hypothetical protein
MPDADGPGVGPAAGKTPLAVPAPVRRISVSKNSEGIFPSEE